MFLGLSYDGYEAEVRELFRKIEKRGGGDSSVVRPGECRRLKNELKKLESTINNYKRICWTNEGSGRKGKGIKNLV